MMLQVYLAFCIFAIIEIKKLFRDYQVCEVNEAHAFLSFLHWNLQFENFPIWLQRIAVPTPIAARTKLLPVLFCKFAVLRVKAVILMTLNIWPRKLIL
jgi:hypothetical protein